MSADLILQRFIEMKQNPKRGWTIDELVALCRPLGIGCARAGAGESHHVISHQKVRGLLTVPADRALKPLYVMLFLRLVEAVLEL